MISSAPGPIPFRRTCFFLRVTFLARAGFFFRVVFFARDRFRFAMVRV
jgi:hypothetical protein